MPVDRIQDIEPAPLGGNRKKCRIQKNPDGQSRTHVLDTVARACPKADSPRWRVKGGYMDVLVEDVPENQPRCSACGGGR